MPAFQNKEGLRNAMRDLTEKTIEQIIDKGSLVILEGGWLNPVRAHALKLKYPNQFYPIFCGYPDADVQQRYGQILDKKLHWLCRTVDKNPLDWMRQQVHNSAHYAHECERLGLPFADFSEFTVGQKQLVSFVADCLMNDVATTQHALLAANQEIQSTLPCSEAQLLSSHGLPNKQSNMAFGKAILGPLALMGLLFSDA